MTAQQEKLVVQDATELLEFVDLRGIVIYEIHGVRVKGGDETAVKISVQERHDESFIEPRFRMVVTDSEAEYTADVGTHYQMSRPIDVSKAVLAEFIERVAIMAAFPFIRESIATTAARMELNVPRLGLLRAGSFSMDEGNI